MNGLLEFDVKIGAAIKGGRERRGLSISDVAETLKLEEALIRQAEGRPSRVSLRTMAKIFRYYGVPDELVYEAMPVPRF